MSNAAFRRVFVTGISTLCLATVSLTGVLLVGVPKLTDSRPLTVLTGSMSPTYPPGDVVIVKPTNTKNLQIGDVITFQPKPNNPELTTHRVVGVVLTGDGRQYVTRGDANGADDPMPIKPEQIRGKVWYSVPYVGYAATWVSGQSVRLVIDLVAMALILYGGYLIAMGAIGRRRKQPEEVTT